MKVFTDFHHGDLYFSLHRLFETRLGWELYRPIGLDWFQKGFWKIAEPYGNALDTVHQYLDINQKGWHAYKNLNGQHYVQDDIYFAWDPGHQFYHKAITFEHFCDMSFDIILSTYQPHDQPFLLLRDQYQPQAKLMAQLGNVGQRTSIKYVIHSVPFPPTSVQDVIYYHQEIDPDQYFYVPPDSQTKNVFSMVNCLPRATIFNTYKSLLSEVDMRAYGASCPQGPLSGSQGVAKYMQLANLGWHIKPLDGFGHTAMGWFASGRPVITQMSDVFVFGGEAPKLFIPGVTCLNLEAASIAENCRLIRRMLEPEENLHWSQKVLAQFDKVINYDVEAEQIKQLLERMLNE